jgi:hypothetical protein
VKINGTQVRVDPSGLVVVTTTDVQAALAELDAAVDALGGGGGGSALASARAVRTAGTVTLSSSFATVDSSLDLTLPAADGDTILYGVNGLWNSDGDWGQARLATVVSGSVVNTTGGTEGNAGWLGEAGLVIPFGSPYSYTIQSGDVDGGNVVLRLQARGNSGGKQLLGSTTHPLQVWAVNLGQ